MFRSVSRAFLVALAMLLIAGCAKRRSTLEPAFTVRPITAETNAANAVAAASVTMAPVNSPVGRISSVNQQVMIAVVTFPVGQVPAAGGRYSVFRAGQKIGELKLSEETADTLRVADITSGTLEVGDEVRTP